MLLLYFLISRSALEDATPRGEIEGLEAGFAE